MTISFDHDDAAYLAWLAAHTQGFIVNAFRNLRPDYLMLHRATCGTISGTPARGVTWTSGAFIKACAEMRQDIEHWAQRSTNGTLHPCGLCRPG
jgi:hypothetical protein